MMCINVIERSEKTGVIFAKQVASRMIKGGDSPKGELVSGFHVGNGSGRVGRAVNGLMSI
jgi:hypothetical protein